MVYAYIEQSFLTPAKAKKMQTNKKAETREQQREIVDRIRREYLEGKKPKDLVKAYAGVSERGVYRILDNSVFYDSDYEKKRNELRPSVIKSIGEILKMRIVEKKSFASIAKQLNISGVETSSESVRRLVAKYIKNRDK